MLLLATACLATAAENEKPWPVDEQLADLHLLRGPWDLGTIHRESVLFVQDAEGKPAAKLLFDAEKVLAVHRADGKQAFQSDKDYQLTADGSSLALPEASRIPFRKLAELYPPKGAPNSIGRRAGHDDQALLFGEGHFFHDQQVEVSYVPRRESRWAGPKPVFATKGLPATIALLRAKKPLTLAVSGDSISRGGNASGYTKAAPAMPPYPDLVAAQLEKTYGSKVTLHNRSVGGLSVGGGVKDIDKLLKHNPDLVVIAYGMNDVGRDPEGFKGAIAKMLARIKETQPAAEIVLVASMLRNPDANPMAPDMFFKYRDALLTLEGAGVAVADLTAVWQQLLKRKRFVDMAGNGYNHPNDYGHRLYAQMILGLLVDRAALAEDK